MKVLRSLLLVASALLATPFAARCDLYTGLVSYWAMDTNNAGLTPDASFLNDLTLMGSPTVVAGQIGNAIQLNATTDYLTINHGTANADTGLPIFGARSYTICLWVKGPNNTGKALFTEGNTNSTGPLVILQTPGSGTSGKLDVILRNDQGTVFLNHVQSTTGGIFNNAWHHIAWVDNKGACQMFIDGNPDAVFNYTPGGTMTVNNTTIGALVRTSVSMQYVGATFDDVAIWERALTLGEIQQVRTNGLVTHIAPRAPVLTSQPADVTRQVGDWVLFSTAAIGNRPFTYQWSKNTSPIAGATDRAYRVSNLNTNNTGESYSVTVFNSAGSSSSTNATLTVAPETAPAVSNGIVAYWPLDQVTNTPPDSPDLYSGNDMILSNMDSNSLVPGRFGNALTFDGLTQFGRRTNGVAIYSLTNYSISFWVNADPTGQNDRRVFSEGSSLNANPLFTLGTDPTATSQSLSVLLRNDGNVAILNGVRSTRPVFDSTWHHVVWTDANGKGRLYIDGNLDETDYTYARGALTLDRTSIGAVLRAGLGNFYFGNIDEPATWNRVLNWTEIQQVMTNGIPLPFHALPPTIINQPSDRTNGVFTGDNVFFSVQAGGTVPLAYQWLRNGAAISTSLNASAGTDMLTLTNVQPSDSGSGFSVVITNAGGAVTSQVALLTVTPYTPATNGIVLNVDFGLTGSPNPQPGFDEMTIGMSPTNFGGVGVTLAGIGTTLADRNRTAGAMVPTNALFMTQAAIYNDFIFANNSTADGTGLSILIERLAPNTKYGLTLWSFDPQSAGARVSDWFEVASGTTNVLQLGYTFDANSPPTNDFEQTLGGVVTSSAAGKLQIMGLRNGGTSFSVFLDAIRLEANPIPTSKLVRTSLTPFGTIRISATGNYPGQAIGFQQTTNLVGGAWVDAGPPSFSSSNGNVVTVEFPVTEDQQFYRAVTPFAP
jgi:hypothetical protein